MAAKVTKQRVPRKIKKVRTSKATNQRAEQTGRGFGPEPEVGFDFTEAPTSEYTMALGWYARFTDIKDVEDHVALAMKVKGYNPKQIAAMKRSNKVSMTMSSISQMIVRECILSDASIAWWTKHIDEAVKIGMGIYEQKAAAGEVVSIRDRTENKALDFIGDIDEIIDQVWMEKLQLDEVKMLDIMNELGLKPAHAKILENFYKDKLERMEADWKEYPRDYNKADIKRLDAMYKKVVEGCHTLGTSSGSADDIAKKVARAAKKTEKEKKNVFKSVKRETAAIVNLKYKPSDNDLGIISVKPSSIVGAQMLIVLNAKYNVLTIYRAATVEGLSVKGTTILNYDEATSESKRAGRAAAIIKQLPEATRAGATKLFQSIKGSPVTLRGRTSEDTLLIKAYK